MKPDASRTTGLAILSALVVGAAMWLAWQGRSASATADAMPAMNPSTDLTRFRASPWRLPEDRMLGFVEIPAGPFRMGSDPGRDITAFENERWSAMEFEGSVDLPTYYIAGFETTVAQYRAFVESSDYLADPQSLRGAGDLPVTYVAWTDALAYARWLTATIRQSTGTLSPVAQMLNRGWEFSLPDEAQWEKAARGTDGRIFPWGNTATRNYANFAASGTQIVGSHDCAPCAFGLADMSGNVWELTRSPLQPYPFDRATQQGDLHADALFVMRGGSFMDAPLTIRAAVRGGIDPGARREFIGFRLVLTRAPRGDVAEPSVQ